MRKIIGLIPLYDDKKESYWMLPGYMKMLEAENAIPLMLPLTSNPKELDCFLDICGGFLLTGGHDISPALYQQERKKQCGACCLLRDEMEIYLLKKAVERGKSVLGICRGIQLMNVCYGGTLYQDLPSEYDGGVEHRMKPPYNRTVHRVSVERNTLLYDILQTEQIGVNSYHHQAIQKLSPSFRAMAISEDGLIEGIYMPTERFVAGVQWHPELAYEDDRNCKKIVEAFVKSVL